MLIAHLSDLHMRPADPAAAVAGPNAMAERVLRAVAALDPRPDAIVITGDVTESGRPEAYAHFRDLLRRTACCPVYVVPGNHDRREAFRAALGDLPGVTEDPDFVQYTADLGGLRLIMLDSVVDGAAFGMLCPRRLDFLDRALEAASGMPVLIGLHHPPLRCGMETLDAIALRDQEAFLAKVAGHGRVLGVLSGHHHRTIIGQSAGTTLLTAPSASGQQAVLNFAPDAPPLFRLEPGGFFLLNWQGGDSLAAHLVLTDDFPEPFPVVCDDDSLVCPG